ncbi:MAG: universal stress protein family [Marmoricola sp.]|nr:universal stress protein family [Marmoricola sp.]
MSDPQVPAQRTPAEHRFVAVVGVDGSAASYDALLWAMRTAYQNSWALEIVTVWPMHAPVVVHGVAGHFCEPRWNAARTQARTVAEALARVESVPTYSVRLENGSVRDLLLSAAEGASVLVLGTDEPDPGAGEGAVGTRLTAEVRLRAGCPVVLVPHDAMVPALVTPNR